MASVQVEGVVVKVVAIEDLYTIDMQTVAGQIVLHPTAAVTECDVLDGDILALNKAQQMGSRDSLIVPRKFLERTSPAVDSAKTADDHIVNFVGKDELDGCAMSPQRDIV